MNFNRILNYLIGMGIMDLYHQYYAKGDKKKIGIAIIIAAVLLVLIELYQ